MRSTVEALAQVEIDRATFFKARHDGHIIREIYTDQFRNSYCGGIYIFEVADNIVICEPRHVELIPIVPQFDDNLCRQLRKHPERWTFTTNQRFVDVMAACAEPRKTEKNDDKWIGLRTSRILQELHESGSAHSIEIHHDAEFVGGVLGLAFGGLFLSLSVFSHRSGAGLRAASILAGILHKNDFAMHDAIIPSRVSRHIGGDMQLRTREIQVARLRASCRPNEFPVIAQNTSIASYLGPYIQPVARVPDNTPWVATLPETAARRRYHPPPTP